MRPASMNHTRSATSRASLTEDEYASFMKVLGVLEDEANNLLEEVKRGG